MIRRINDVSEQQVSPMAMTLEDMDDLMGRMTLAEKIGQLVMMGPSLTGPEGRPFHLMSAVAAGEVGHVLNVTDRQEIAALRAAARTQSRLGIPLLFGLDIVHGYRTVFPVSLAEAGAFDPALWQETARWAALEARADDIDLTFAPMIDICRDPRWGRINEGPGEDPWLGAAFARAKVLGFQGDESGESITAPYIAATAKHFVGYGAVAAGREYAGADMSLRLLHEVYLPPFRAAVEAGVAAIMPAFNNLAGVPLTAHYDLLQGLLRHRWGFEGVIISDYAAIAELVAQGVAQDAASAAARALRAGVDVDMMGHAYAEGLERALAQGLVTMADIDASLRRVLRLKLRLGLFASPPVPEIESPPSVPRHMELAYRAAVESCVLLKNDQDILPLPLVGGPLAVIGPLAQAQADLLGPWSAEGRPDEVADILTSIESVFAGREILHAAGCGILEGTRAQYDAALALAARADGIVLCLGESCDMSGEGGSRARPELPEIQQKLALDILALGKPVVLVLCAGRPLVATQVLERVDAALMAWFPGHAGGTAIADVLCGRAAPGGRLAVSWPASTGQIPITYRDMPVGRPYKAGDRLTSSYLDMAVEPLYAFGHGLDYVRFVLEDVVLQSGEIKIGESLQVRARVSNAGVRAASAVVFLFIHDRVASIARPVLECRAAQKVRLAAGAQSEVQFELKAEDFAFPDADLQMRQEAGVISILVGFSAAMKDLRRADVVIV